VECLRQLWSGRGAQFEGEFFSLAGARLGFTPPQPLLIYIAAMGPQMLALTGRVADGIVLSAGLSPAYCTKSLAAVDAGAAKAGRDTSSLRKAAYLLFAVSEDGRNAREIVRNKLAFLFRNRALAENIEATGVPVDQEKVMDAVSRRDFDEAASLISDDAVDAYGVAGNPAEAIERLRAFVDAGVTEPVLMVQGDGAERALALDFLREWTT
jgi:5,10-methylenetetrahydromethanopterin reductase